MADFTIPYTDNAKAKMEEAYGLTGQPLADAIIAEMRVLISNKLRATRKAAAIVAVNGDFEWDE